MIFTVKHDGQHKARFAAAGHLTQPTIESVYSGVVSIHSIVLLLLIAKINDLEIYQADVGSAYLEAHTKKRCSSSQAKNSPPSVWKGMYLLYLQHYIWVRYRW